MKLFLFLIVFSLSVLVVVPAYSQGIISTSLTGTYHNSEISLEFSDGTASGKLTTDDDVINIDNLKVIEKKDRFFIFDKQNNLKILSKQINDEKYLVLIKSDDTKLRFVTDSNEPIKNIGQRNFLDEMNKLQSQTEQQKLENLTFKEQQLQEKQNKLDEALKKFQDSKQPTTTQQEIIPNSEKTKEDILADFEKSKEVTGMELVENKEVKKETTTTKTETTTTKTNIKIFVSLPHSVEWKKELVYDILVTDDSGHRYNSNYKDYVGNELEQVALTGKIVSPSGGTIEEFSGTTDKNGNHIGRFLIPDNSPTRGEYTVSVNAVYTQKDGTKSESNTSNTFFVFPVQKSSFNDPPIADAGVDGHYTSGSTVTLDGSKSSDVENSPLSYTWSQTSGTTITLDNNKAVKPEFTMIDEIGTFVFSLIVNDGSKDSLSPDTVTITSLHLEAGSNQTQTGLGLVTLDGSQSGTALPNGNMTYFWSFLKVPNTSGIISSSLSDSTITNPTFTPDVIGNYTLQLDASDDKLTDVDVINIEIE